MTKYECKWFHTTRKHPHAWSDAKGRELMELVHDYYDEKDALMADVLRLAGEKRCILIVDMDPNPKQRFPVWWYLHPSLRFDGWQLSSFDYWGARCHYDVKHGDVHELSYDLPDNFECWYYGN